LSDFQWFNCGIEDVFGSSANHFSLAQFSNERKVAAQLSDAAQIADVDSSDVHGFEKRII